MPRALILSSHVAGSRVGGSAQVVALAPFGIDGLLVPTVLYGRHPGWGPPGGGKVAAETLQGMVDGLAANGLLAELDLILTGYFADPDQVAVAARAIDAARAAGGSSPIVIVDPTMGDDGKGLYVPEAVAQAIQAQLISRADLVACNAWELAYLTGLATGDPEAAVAAALALGKPTLVSSVYRGSEIGVVYADGARAWLALHAARPQVPNGTGDLLTALFAASIVDGQTVPDGLARAVGGVAETVKAAKAGPDLPIVAMGVRIRRASPAVRVERLG
ncbi:MAG: pyridoxine kinase [Caulobacter sp.]|nr:pyridoxine kinase [Caulobacter sp.]